MWRSHGTVLVAFCTFTVIGCDSPEPETESNDAAVIAAVDVIKSYADRDIDRSDQYPNELRLAFERLIPDPKRDLARDFGWKLSPDFVLRWPGGVGEEFALIERQRSVPSPFPGKCRITLIQSDGSIRAQSAFWVHLSEIRVSNLKESVEPIFVAGLTYRGFNFGREYYAILGDRIDLVRIERTGEKIDRNSNFRKHTRSGPETINQPVSAWEADLASENQALILRALTWIGGRHLNPKQGDQLQDQIDESLDEIRAVRAVRASPRIITRIKELLKSDNRWIREAADLAANPDDVFGASLQR